MHVISECKLDCDAGPFAPDPEDKLKHPSRDKVCFWVGTDFWGGKSEIRFNRQWRKLHDQGGVKTEVGEVEVYCEDMCQSQFGMPAEIEIKDKRAHGGSRQVVYTKMDDMCDNCK